MEFIHHNFLACNVNSEQEMAIDMKQCAAYELTSLSKKKTQVETNPVYEEVV